MRLPTTLFAACLAATAHAQDMIAVTWDGEFLAVDSTTGAAESIGGGLLTHHSLARSSDGRLWTTVDRFLAELDPVELEATVRWPLPLRVLGLATGPGDTLYGVLRNPGSSLGDQLIQIDLATGFVAPIGGTSFDGIQALAFNGGVLFGWDIREGLLTLNTDTGVGTTVGPATLGRDIQWMTFDENGTLYGGRSNIFTIDQATGVATQVAGISGRGIRGVEFGGFVRPFGQGCGVTAPVQLSARGSIEPGGILTTTSVGHPGTTAVSSGFGALLIGIDTTSFQGAPLPINLDPILGTTGCSLYVDPLVVLPGRPLSVTEIMTVPLPLPQNIGAFGEMHLQHFSLQSLPGATPVFSNGLTVVF